MPDPDAPIPSVESDEPSDLDSESESFHDMYRNLHLHVLADEIYGEDVTEEQLDTLDEQLLRSTQKLGDLESAVSEVRGEFFVKKCRSSIDKRLELANRIRKEMEAYEQAAAKIRNVVSPRYLKALKKKDANSRDWETAKEDMHGAFVLASKSLQELEKLCDKYEELQISAIKPAYELMCEPYNLEYGNVEGFYAPEPDPVAPLMSLNIEGYDDWTRRQLAKGFRHVKTYQSFMKDPKQKEMREYAKHKVDEDDIRTEGIARSKTEDPCEVEKGQGTAVQGNSTANPSQPVSPRSQAPSLLSHRNMPAVNLNDTIQRDGTSTTPGTMDARVRDEQNARLH